jgi:hypothetical protein
MTRQTPPPAAAAIIERLGLAPHPEGGWYRETFRAPPAPGATRGAATMILFLLEAGRASHWHRIDAEEMWIFQAGAPLALSVAEADGAGAVDHQLGSDILGGEALQHVVRPGQWQAARTLGDWSLVACVVAPAFDFAGFELAPRDWSPVQPTRS